MSLNTHNLVLLTGAGFTANFGGFLAREMWSKIFNHPKLQSHPDLRRKLLENFDFEEIYYEVLNDESFSSSEKEDFKEAVESAYLDLDNTIKDWVPDDGSHLAVSMSGEGGFNKLLDLFLANRGIKSLIFTLNQDLFLERHRRDFRSFGAKCFPEDFYQPRSFIQRNHFIKLPTREKIEEVKERFLSQGKFIYIKLHGSYGWLSQDGSSAMVLGKNKPEDIEKEPLLKWYSELFKDVIRDGNKKMLIT